MDEFARARRGLYARLKFAAPGYCAPASLGNMAAAMQNLSRRKYDPKG